MVLVSILFVFCIVVFLGWYFSALSEQMFEEDEVIYYRTVQKKRQVSYGVTHIDKYKSNRSSRSKSA